MSECWTKSADASPERRDHYGLAVSCASRFYGRGVPREELIGEAEAALLWAAARFDETRGVRFSTYAIPFVLGALKELCRRAAPMSVPRSELRVLTAAENARDKLRTERGCEPTISELAQAVGAPPERLGEMLAARERMRHAEPLPDERDLSVADGGFEDWVLVKDMVLRLPMPYAQVLWLRFARGWSQADVARRFHVGQPQVSRWERRGRELLKESLSEEEEEEAGAAQEGESRKQSLARRR